MLAKVRAYTMMRPLCRAQCRSFFSNPEFCLQGPTIVRFLFRTGVLHESDSDIFVALAMTPKSRGWGGKWCDDLTSGSVTLEICFPREAIQVLGGSWVVISGDISRVTIVITPIRGLIAPLITTHEPPSKPFTLRRLHRKTLEPTWPENAIYPCKFLNPETPAFRLQQTNILVGA